MVDSRVHVSAPFSEVPKVSVHCLKPEKQTISLNIQLQEIKLLFCSEDAATPENAKHQNFDLLFMTEASQLTLSPAKAF